MDKSIELKVHKLILGDGRTLENANIGIKNGNITEVTNEKLKEDYDETIELTNKYVMPGLMDAHVHIRYWPADTMEEARNRVREYQTIIGVENAKRALMAGVTSLADAGSEGYAALAVRDAINNKVTMGPRLFVSGPIIVMTGAKSSPGPTQFTGANQIRQATREILFHFGADFIKTSASGAISYRHTKPRHPKLNVDELSAAVEEAHKADKKIHVHCYGDRAITNTIEARADCIVHGQSISDKNIKGMKERDMVLLPTLKTYCDDMKHIGEEGFSDRIITTGIWEETEPNFRNAVKKGVTIGMGTDAGMIYNYFGENQYELKQMVDWGMTPSQAITAGTLNSAKSIGLDDKLGTIEPGKYADLLILGSDPTKEIHHVWKSLEKIMLNGRFIK